jgi:hypothetical protein
MDMEFVKESLDLMINKEIGSVAFYKLQEDDIRIPFTRMYLDGKGIFYKENETNHRKYGKGVEFYIITDEEYIDGAEEYLHCMSIFDTTTKAENKLLKAVNKKKLEKPYIHFMTKEEMENVRFDFMYYLTDVNYEVRYDKGLVIIY